MGIAAKWRGKPALPALAACVLGLALVAGTALAAAGQLDTTFSGDGKRTTTFGPGTDEATNVAVQADGRIVVVGLSDQGANADDFAVARYTPNGGLDTTFSGDGKRLINFAPGSAVDEADGVAIQSNGRIVVAGYSAQGSTGDDFAIARLNPNGSLDTSFSGDGKQVTPINSGTSGDEAEDVAIQPNGRIVVGGYADQGSGQDWAIARYMPNGSLDTSFSGDGKRTVSVGSDFEEGEDIAIQANGRIVFAGTTGEGGGGDFAVARFKPNGNLDTSFSNDGKRLTTFGPGTDVTNGVGIQANGRIVIAGYSDQGVTTGWDFALARFMPNGSLDASFSGNGKQIAAFGGGAYEDEGEDMVIQQNGKIVVAGSTTQTGEDFAIARFNPNGNLDTSFSGDGRRVISFNNGTNDDHAHGVAIQANGRIVVVGLSDQGGTTGTDFAVARLLSG